MTAVRVGTRGFMYRYKVPLSELQWVDTRRFRWTMRKIYGDGEGNPFSNVHPPESVEFYLKLYPAPPLFLHFVLATTIFENNFFQPVFLPSTVFNPILLSSPSPTHLNRIKFFPLPPLPSRLYFYLSKNSRQWKKRSSDRGEKLGNFVEDPIETCQPLIPPPKGKTFIPSRGRRWTPLKLGV